MFETLADLSANLLPIKSPIASSVFWNVLLEAVFIEYVVTFSEYQEDFVCTHCLNV